MSLLTAGTFSKTKRRSKSKSKDVAQELQVFSISNAGRLNDLRNIIWEEHMIPIQQASYGGVEKFTISIRETGLYSINRLAEGARAKPHTILEKSIKESSMEKSYGPQWRNNDVMKLYFDTISGFAGHYDKNTHALLGLRVDIPSEELKNYLIKIGVKIKDCRTVPEPNCQYIDLKPAAELLQNDKMFAAHFYTGDYDIHELYFRNSIIPEASEKKVKVLNELNSKICIASKLPRSREVISRCGSFELSGNPKRIHMSSVGPDNQHRFWAMFQHGDQATYKMNQHLEANAMGGQGRKAQIVDAVNQESNDKLAWCYKGNWFVTRNKVEHRKFREIIGLRAPWNWIGQQIYKRGLASKSTKRRMGNEAKTGEKKLK